MFKVFRSILFLVDPERAHHLTAFLARIWYSLPFTGTLLKHQHISVMGLDFPNRVGLAAGFDKNAEMLPWLAKLGFGFVEIGTVTPIAQEGNPKPRLFRLIEDKAIINRMGFNNIGVDAVVQNLKNRPKNLIVGGNIGKNKLTPNERALDDYLICFEKLFDVVDYFVVNVSSPNTPGLRELQEKDTLLQILEALQAKNMNYKSPKPILLKIAPDLSFSQLDDIIETIQKSGITGVIATNTSISREDLKTSPHELERIGQGGLSGMPLTQKSTEVIAYLRKKLGKNIVIIGVGGIMNEQDAQDKFQAGVDLIQLYTGFIYSGPRLIRTLSQQTI